MEIGRVIYVSPNSSMLVVEHDEGWSVVEMLGSEGEIARDDELKADWSELGGGFVSRDGERFDVYFQGTWGDRSNAVERAKTSG